MGCKSYLTFQIVFVSQEESKTVALEPLFNRQFQELSIYTHNYGSLLIMLLDVDLNVQNNLNVRFLKKKKYLSRYVYGLTASAIRFRID